ncbi:MAG: protein kinase, partial [Anaerolineae bacterium]
KIAEGGFAEIYEGQELVTKEKVAIKILHPRHHANKAEHKRLLGEGAIGLRLRHHPHVVRVFKVGQVGRAPYMVMEFIPGETLREIMKKAGTFKERTVL